MICPLSQYGILLCQSIDLISLLSCRILKFPRLKKHPLRKPLCHPGRVGSPSQHTEESPVAEPKGLILVADPDKNKLSPPCLHNERQGSKHLPPGLKLPSSCLLLYALITLTPTKTEANICHCFMQVLDKI